MRYAWSPTGWVDFRNHKWMRSRHKSEDATYLKSKLSMKNTNNEIKQETEVLVSNSLMESRKRGRGSSVDSVQSSESDSSSVESVEPVAKKMKPSPVNLESSSTVESFSTSEQPA